MLNNENRCEGILYYYYLCIYNSEFKEKARRWTILDAYYIPTRYPNGLPDGIPANVYTEEAAKNAVALAEESVEWIRPFFE